ncbi:hypothetical protein CsSME_00000681 [Camellia sinensis var. sinensis]
MRAVGGDSWWWRGAGEGRMGLLEIVWWWPKVAKVEVLTMTAPPLFFTSVTSPSRRHGGDSSLSLSLTGIVLLPHQRHPLSLTVTVQYHILSLTAAHLSLTPASFSSLTRLLLLLFCFVFFFFNSLLL